MMEWIALRMRTGELNLIAWKIVQRIALDTDNGFSRLRNAHAYQI
jgi:hypothetical protein